MEFASYWQYTDMVTKCLFFILIALSVMSWITGILRIYHNFKMKGQVATDLSQAVRTQSQSMSVLTSAERKTVTEQVLLQQIGRYRYKGEKGLSLLGTTASVAPFLGLFGTVWGIFHALHSIGESGQAGLSQVAGPVGEALIMTGLGLAVAIPAVVFYNIAVRLNRRTLFTANDMAYSLLGETAKGERKEGTAVINNSTAKPMSQPKDSGYSSSEASSNASSSSAQSSNAQSSNAH